MKHLCSILMVMGLLFSGGCDYVLVDLPSLVGFDDDSGTDSQAKTYDGKVYLIGTLTGNLKEELGNSITFSDYTNGVTDGAIVISSDAFGTLTQDQLAGLTAAYQADQPIILVNATEAQITTLGQQFIDDSFTYNLPYGIDYAEIYAIDKEEGGHVWQWSLYPPDLTNDEDSDEEQQARLNDSIDWLKENSVRMETAAAVDATQNAKAQAADAASGNNDLTQLASAFVNQSNFSYYGNRYQITHFVYSCHSYATNDDWFYVQQQCVFYGGGAFGKTLVSYNQEGKGWYMDKIELDSGMTGYDYNSAAVGMIQSSPETANNETSVTSGVDFTIGGEVGVDKDGPSAKISGGVTISNSRTVNVRDCEVINSSNDRGNNAHWKYNFNRCSSISYALYAGLTDPPNLSINTFQPVNQWIWRMQPVLRNNNVPMHVRLDVTLCWTWGIIDFWWATHAEHQTTSGGSWEYNVYIPYPPNTD